MPAASIWPGGKQRDGGGAAAATPLDGVLDPSHVREWLRADVAEGVAFLHTALVQVMSSLKRCRLLLVRNVSQSASSDNLLFASDLLCKHPMTCPS